MSDDAVFVVDASSWICLHEERYCPDIMPGLWSELRAFGEQGRIKVPRLVIEEVGRGDGVGAWLETIKPSIVPPVTAAISARVGEIMTAYPDLVADYTADADPWLIALAERHGWVLVTEERSSPGKKPKIPNVCQDLDIKWIDCTTMIRRLSIRWESGGGEHSSSKVRKLGLKELKDLVKGG